MSLEHWIGRLLRGVRPGPSKLVFARAEFQNLPHALAIESPAFACGSRMAPRFTAVGEEISPPLKWSHLPPHTKDLVLIVEDADPPLPKPLVHCVAYNIPVSLHGLAEGTMPPDRDKQHAVQPAGFLMGKNSSGWQAWKGPRPVSGHGVHHYYFQLYALTTKLEFKEPPSKDEIVRAMSGNALAVATCIGTFNASRESDWEFVYAFWLHEST